MLIDLAILMLSVVVLLLSLYLDILDFKPLVVAIGLEEAVYDFESDDFDCDGVEPDDFDFDGVELDDFFEFLEGVEPIKFPIVQCMILILYATTGNIL